MSITTSANNREMLSMLDALAENKNITPVGAVAFEAAKLIRRLLAGDFTVEEIHGFCHKLPDIVSAKEFANGCMAYQTQLYGNSPVMDLLRETDRVLSSWGIAAGDNNIGSHLRQKIKEQIL